jgi:hypothetical protein
MKIKEYFTLLLAGVILFASQCYAFPPDNDWSVLVDNQCRTDSQTCRNHITQAGVQQQLQACIRCCGKGHEDRVAAIGRRLGPGAERDRAIADSNTCHSYCFCECVRGAIPNSPATTRLCSFPRPTPTPAASNTSLPGNSPQAAAPVDFADILAALLVSFQENVLISADEATTSELKADLVILERRLKKLQDRLEELQNADPTESVLREIKDTEIAIEKTKKKIENRKLKIENRRN